MFLPSNVNSIFYFSAECEQKEIVLSDRDLFEVLHSAAINGHPSLVDALLSRVSKSSGYNQDCMNIIMRLINKNQEDEAFKVLMTMKPGLASDGRPQQSGNFFLKQIVKANCASDKIVGFCRKLIDSGMNHYAFFRALDASNTYGNVELSSALLKEIQVQKENLRPSSFWPLLVSVRSLYLSLSYHY